MVAQLSAVAQAKASLHSARCLPCTPDGECCTSRCTPAADQATNLISTSPDMSCEPGQCSPSTSASHKNLLLSQTDTSLSKTSHTHPLPLLCTPRHPRGGENSALFSPPSLPIHTPPPSFLPSPRPPPPRQPREDRAQTTHAVASPRFQRPTSPRRPFLLCKQETKSCSMLVCKSLSRAKV